MMKISSIILAAGKGSRMGSDLPKVLHPLNNKPLLHHVLDTAETVTESTIYVIIGHQGSRVKESTSEYDVTYVLQHEQLGTGHAICQAAPYFKDNQDEDIIILSGDCPLITKETIYELVSHHQKNNLLGTVLTTTLSEPKQYGRILRNTDDSFYAIRESKDCTNDQLSINEINSGIYCFNSGALFHYLKLLNTNNAQGEYYLTDVLEEIGKRTQKIDAFHTNNSTQLLGVNTKEELSFIESHLKRIG